MAEEETIGDVLLRVSALKKDDMVTEVEAYGLEVHSSWTKDEIMDHFEQFLTSPEAVEPEPEPVPESTEVLEGAPPPEVLRTPEGDVINIQQLEDPPQPPPVQAQPTVRITASPGWGNSPRAKAP